MADIGVGTRAKIIGTSGIAAVIGTRCYADKRPQGSALPCVVLEIVSGADEPHLTGLCGVTHQRVQVESMAATRQVANSLSTLIRDTLCSSGGRCAWGTVNVDGATPQGGERWDRETKDDGSDDDIYITARDYLVSFQG